MMIRAVLFDLDGVLVDACEWHKLSLNKALIDVAGFELNEEEHKSTFNGLPTKKKLELLLKQNRISDQQYDTIWRLKQFYTKETISATAKNDSVKIELMTFLKQRNILVACVTNSITETAKLMLETTGQYQYMDLLISNEQVVQPKPHGEGYIRAMINFGVYPEETLIVEDSEVGIKAANSTGAHVYQVKDSYQVTLNNVKMEIEKW
jgi:beta-phosphoglucomutase